MFQVLEDRTLLAQSVWAFPGADGHLVYTTTAAGDRLPDFSMVGYQSGLVPLPDTPGGVPVTVQADLSPTPGDQTARIQAAIDQVSALPLDANGYRGAVLLRAGEYPIEGQLLITTSGVVLEGEGTSATSGTRLRAAGTDPRTLIQISGSGSRQIVPGTTHNLIDNYVPVGATSFQVDSTAGLAVGDTVIVDRPSPANWIQDIGMDQLTYPWQPGTKNLDWDRVITNIDGNTITVDAPLTNALEQRYGGGTIYKYRWPGRPENVGIENLYGQSDFADSTDENHSWTFIDIKSAQNSWVHDVVSQYFAFACVELEPGAKWITVQDSQCLDPISQITGERRYSFDINHDAHDGGQLSLFLRDYARQGRHDFTVQSQVAGPNAFVDCYSEQAYNEVGPHQRWSTGTLFDNVETHGNSSSGLNIRNAGDEGTGHGWQGANDVVWNSTADRMSISSPPTAQNWVIGPRAGTYAGNGIYDSQGTPVDTRSLYYAQLADRLATLSQQVSLPLLANAYVYDAQPNTNFGGAQSLVVKTSSPGHNRIAYLQLDLTTLPANVATVQLQLYGLITGGSASETAVQTNLYAADPNWDEYSVTWNTRPAVGELLGALTVTRTGQWFTLDVTPYVQAGLAAGQNTIALALQNPLDTSAVSSFNAIEAAVKQPQLLVGYYSGFGPRAAAGKKGASPMGESEHGMQPLLDAATGSTRALVPTGSGYQRLSPLAVLAGRDANLKSWVDCLQAGASRLHVATAIRGSPEHRGLEGDQLYTAFLRRAADPAGRAAWANLLAAGLSEAEAALALLTSDELWPTNGDPAAPT